ncbi:MAG TPA: antibiotic biosynthesis monooxygenase [Chloroflexia bacterium]|nr:antibiotic biosynthesis monooxygenase [Chloroflexia bacterium]
MLINVWSRGLKPEMIDEAVAFFKASVSPFTHEATGIEKQMVGLDRAANRMIMVTVYKSEEAYKAQVSSPQFQEFIKPLEKFYATPLEIHDYEVVYDI